MKPLFCLTIFLGSLLLFAIQPMVGKILLPSFGGTSAVWTTCMLFFQGLLLLGYGYAHFLSGRLGPRWQVKLHLALLALVTIFLPMQARAAVAPAADDNPSLWLLWQLGWMTGLPFLVVSSNAPLLQRWYSVAAGDQGKDPYFLYAFSNAGSLLALLAYPLLMERSMGLTAQSSVWTAGFALLAICFSACGWFVFRGAAQGSAADVSATTVVSEPPLSWRQRWNYIGLAAIPSSLMLGVTTFVTTDAGSVPLLWVVPLGLYLLTFILGFARRQLLPHASMVRTLPHLVLLVALLLLINPANSAWRLVPAHLLTFFVVAMVCHGELARLRPGSQRLTEFFFLLSVGGVAGGLFNAVVAPLLFSNVLEYPLVLVLACLMHYQPGTVAVTGKGWVAVARRVWRPVLVATYLILVGRTLVSAELSNIVAVFYLGMVMGAGFFRLAPERQIRFVGGLATLLFAVGLYISERNVISIERGFFGVIKVKEDAKSGVRLLVHGTTVHGIQQLSGDPTTPLSYYHWTGPVGDLFRHAQLPAAARVAVIGLGAGSIASYATPGQQFDFFEIDPLVCQYASDPRMFAFLSQSAGKCRIELGDARIRLKHQLDQRLAGKQQLPVRQVSRTTGEREEPGNAGEKRYDLMVLDAFSSDAIPCHLMTREAFAIYLESLQSEGMLAVHISNRFLDLEPLCAALAADAGLQARIRFDLCETDADCPHGKKSSIYVVMSRNQEFLKRISASGEWRELNSRPDLQIWTDDYSSIFDVLR